MDLAGVASRGSTLNLWEEIVCWARGASEPCFITSFPSCSVIFGGCLDGFERFEQASAWIWLMLQARVVY
jgi:hypothetical protein